MPQDGRSNGGDELDDAATRATTLTDGRPRASGADSGRPVWPVFVVLALAVPILDQLAKAWIVSNVDPARPLALVDDYLRFVISHNTGGLFGLFRDQAPVFAIVSVGVMALIVGYHARAGRSLLLSVALGLLLGGAIGNFIDRIRLGYVVDFVDAGIGGVRWYTFNLADAAVSGALLLLVLLAIRPSLAGEGGDRDSVKDSRVRGDVGPDA